MKKGIISLLSLSVVSASYAAPLTPDQALERMAAGGVEMILTRGQAPQLRGVVNDRTGQPALYVFTYSGDEGFLLLTADDATAPVAGYSATNGFDLAMQSENVASWMSLYADQVEAARGLPPYRDTRTRAGEKAEIKPMLTTIWNQTSPYNNLCPTVGGWRSVTGCVATAMAQVMNYWQYPPKGFGEIAFSPSSIDGTLSMDFSETVFDWANMLDDYRGGEATRDNITAVATLMKACGYSVKMDYTPGASSAYSRDIANALKTYFGYDQGASRKDREDYSSQQAWNNMIYDDLANVGPVILNGQSSGGGHSFVCDGYDGNGYYHINWGWGGLSDGYFLLDYLTPSEVGTGGGTGKYDGYNINQDAVTGIMPPVGRLIPLDVTVDNAASDSGNVSGKGYIYRIMDPSWIEVSVTLRIAGGHISSPLYVQGYETDPNTLSNGKTVIDTTFSDNINASDGEVTYSSVLSIPDFNPSKFYTLNFSYDLKGKRTTIDSIKLGASAGVDGMEADSGLQIRIGSDFVEASGDEPTALTLFSADGRTVAFETGLNPRISTAGLPSGVYFCRAADSSGNVRTVKLLPR